MVEQVVTVFHKPESYAGVARQQSRRVSDDAGEAWALSGGSRSPRHKE